MHSGWRRQCLPFSSKFCTTYLDRFHSYLHQVFFVWYHHFLVITQAIVNASDVVLLYQPPAYIFLHLVYSLRPYYLRRYRKLYWRHQLVSDVVQMHSCKTISTLLKCCNISHRFVWYAYFKLHTQLIRDLLQERLRESNSHGTFHTARLYCSWNASIPWQMPWKDRKLAHFRLNLNCF